jgi:mannose-6-phosphate isomerase-like protein (cupin superfamily)
MHFQLQIYTLSNEWIFLNNELGKTRKRVALHMTEENDEEYHVLEGKLEVYDGH